jgi:fibronectin type 3 domain-containing protein
MKKVLLVMLALLVISAVAIVVRQLKSGGRHSITITWQAATAANGSATVPLRYNIYRSDDAGRSYTQMARGVVETTYVDGSVQSGKSYRYVVTSIDGTGRESIRSEAIDVRVP